MKVAPCKDCQDRTMECHGTCEKYKEWLNLRKPTDEWKSDKEYAQYVAYKSAIYRRKEK